MCKLSYKRSFDCYLETFNAICTINGLKNPMYVESNAASDFPRAMMNQAKTVCFIRSGMHFHRVGTTNGLENQRQGTPKLD
ncbi:Protein CBG19455 [Caenorhabditis briggsae]|uniref:Protein CBG19455 n=1 Tax=Caenorhabditis briggsae TaxID=6238 RepID=A8XVP7_CAEBR|nr:Protein CBG19455 [Caenorhabditis briggsae]CAP36700.1 Protein CBG19455 [Caenorhabditis briggsae]